MIEKTPKLAWIVEAVITFILSGGLVGFGVGFMKHFNQPPGYVLPWIPNVFDSIFIIVSGVFFLYQFLKYTRGPKNSLKKVAQDLHRSIKK